MNRDAVALASVLLGSFGLTVGLAVAAERRRAARVRAWNDVFLGRTAAFESMPRRAGSS